MRRTYGGGGRSYKRGSNLSLVASTVSIQDLKTEFSLRTSCLGNDHPGTIEIFNEISRLESLAALAAQQSMIAEDSSERRSDAEICAVPAHDGHVSPEPVDNRAGCSADSFADGGVDSPLTIQSWWLNDDDQGNASSLEEEEEDLALAPTATSSPKVVPSLPPASFPGVKRYGGTKKPPNHSSMQDESWQLAVVIVGDAGGGSSSSSSCGGEGGDRCPGHFNTGGGSAASADVVIVSLKRSEQREPPGKNNMELSNARALVDKKGENRRNEMMQNSMPMRKSLLVGGGEGEELSANEAAELERLKAHFKDVDNSDLSLSSSSSESEVDDGTGGFILECTSAHTDKDKRQNLLLTGKHPRSKPLGAGIPPCGASGSESSVPRKRRKEAGARAVVSKQPRNSRSFDPSKDPLLMTAYNEYLSALEGTFAGTEEGMKLSENTVPLSPIPITEFCRHRELFV